MDARSSAIWLGVAAAFFLVMVFPSVGFSDPVHIYTGDFNLPIPKPDSNDTYISKGWMEDAIIKVPDHFIITDMDIQISITHTNVFDLQIFLRSPTEKVICLNMFDFKKEFSVYPNYTNTIFDDEALLSIKEGNAPFTGRFRPLEPYKLSEFDGEDAYGLWRLQIYDAYWWDTGTFNHLELMISAPEPATAMLLLLGLYLMRLQKRCGNFKNS
jgi:subtilisin-like proprotein convertase family protein